MRMLSFMGGVHPAEQKHFTDKKPVENLPLPERVFIPLSQHTGAPAKAVVQKGDLVKKGQLIAEAGGFVSANIHASISGTVVKVDDYPHPFGRPQPAVEIESDGKDEPDSSLSPVADWENAKPADLKQRISDAGIVGMGGATFPTFVKLSPPEDKNIDSLIINGAECEPYVTADNRLMIEDTEKVIAGTRIIMRILGLTEAVVAVENNKPEAIARLADLTREVDGVRVAVMKVKYPQGSEKQLIKAVLGREVPAGGLPMDAGALVQNVGTASAIFDAVVSGVPLIERIVTVTGSGVKEPRNLRARIGTPISKLIEFCGGFQGERGKLILGGPMMGIPQSAANVPVIKGTNGVLILTRGDLTIRDAGPCIRCGSCVKVCPMFLTPNAIGLFARNECMEEAEKYGVMDCMECGSCAYACPSHIPLVQLFRFAKSEINARRRKAKSQGGK